MTNRRIFFLLGLLLISAVLLLTSCTSGRRQRGPVDEKGSSPGKVIADAYLFDAKIYRHGKPTSIRLELYAMSDTVYVYGRAYLGKGALKARITADSLVAIFPTEQEYLSDKISEVMSSGECSNNSVKGLHLAQLLIEPPAAESLEGIHISEENRSANSESKHGLTLYPADSASCKWALQLDYDTRAGRQVLVRLQFDDGNGTKLNAALRESKPRSRIPKARVTLDLPADYTRLSPR